MVLPGKEEKATNKKTAAKNKTETVEAGEVPETTKEVPQEETPETEEELSEEDEEHEEVSLEQVAVDHETRLRNIEATLFRLKNI